MRETAGDLERLQRLLDDSVEQASGFLRSSFQMPERSLSAEQLVAPLEGSLTVALGTVTARGEPRVAPINAFFLRAALRSVIRAVVSGRDMLSTCTSSRAGCTRTLRRP